MDVPNVTRTEYQLLDVADVRGGSIGCLCFCANQMDETDQQGFLNLIDSDANAKDDVKVPDSDLGREIEKAFEDGKDLLVTIVAAMGMFGYIRFFTIPLSAFHSGERTRLTFQVRSRLSPGRRPPLEETKQQTKTSYHTQQTDYTCWMISVSTTMVLVF